MAGLLNNRNIETADTEEEAAEGLAEALRMEVEEVERSEGKEEGGGTLRAGRGLRSIASSIGRNFSSARRGSCQLQS